MTKYNNIEFFALGSGMRSNMGQFVIGRRFLAPDLHHRSFHRQFVRLRRSECLRSYHQAIYRKILQWGFGANKTTFIDLRYSRESRKYCTKFPAAAKRQLHRKRFKYLHENANWARWDWSIRIRSEAAMRQYWRNGKHEFSIEILFIVECGVIIFSSLSMHVLIVACRIYFFTRVCPLYPLYMVHFVYILYLLFDYWWVMSF